MVSPPIGNGSDKKPTHNKKEQTTKKRNPFLQLFHNHWRSDELRNFIKHPKTWIELVALATVIWYTRDTGKTLDEMKKQTPEIAKSANAARDAAKTADQTLKLDERPWITVAGDKNQRFSPATLHAPLAVTNNGRTPAINIQADFYVEIVPNGFEPHFEGTIPHTTWSIGMIAPNDPKPVTATRIKPKVGYPGEGQDAPVTPTEKIILDEGNAWLAVHGMVRYSDVFGIPHWTRYCSANYFKSGTSYSSRSCTGYNNVDHN